jgi:hypothetical protein
MIANSSVMTEPSEPDQTQASVPDEPSAAERIAVKDAFFAAIDEAPGYKATQLAEAAGVTDATLSFMRNQGRDVRISTFQRLLDAMPTDVYLRFYQNLGGDLAQVALTDAETSPGKIISALLKLCDDESLMSLVQELGAISKERQEQGSQVLSILALLIMLMRYCEVDEVPTLITEVGKYTSTALARASENPSEERR